MKNKKPFCNIFPSFITISALCMGITAIKYTFEGNFEMAVIMVLIACFMDGIDGISARMLNSSSNFGAQLDSLCDLVNFGVAPAVIMYNWQLVRLGMTGWMIALIYASCMSLRLARYNVESINKKSNYFNGISSPCAGILALSPLIATFQLVHTNYFNSVILGCFILFIALMMVSKIPTLSTKCFSIKRKDIPILVLLFSIFSTIVIFMPWKFIPILSIMYLFSIPFTWYHYKKKPLFKKKYKFISAS